MEQHKCINIAIIEALRADVQTLKTKSEIHENNINSVKEDIKDMKGTVKEISEKMNTEFKNIDKKNISVLTTEVVLLIGVIVDILINVFHK